MRSRLVMLLATLALLAGACGGETDVGEVGEEETTPAETAMEAETSPAGTDTEDGMAEGEATVAVASSDLGEILVDEEGMTLYLFMPDDQGDPTCTEDCVDSWPLFEGPATAGEGVDDALLGTAEHPDGTTMATYNDWPLYYFAADEGAGDVNGQGVGDNWYVVSPEGEPVREGGDAVGGY